MKEYIGKGSNEAQEVMGEYIAKGNNNLIRVADRYVQNYDGTFKRLKIGSDVYDDWNYGGSGLVDLILPKTAYASVDENGDVQLIARDITDFKTSGITGKNKIRKFTIEDSDVERQISLYTGFLSSTTIEEAYFGDNIKSPSNGLYSCFQQCSALKKVTIKEDLSTSNITFYDSRNLEELHIDKFTQIVNTLCYIGLSNKGKLTSINLPLVTSIGTNAFIRQSIVTLDLPSIVTLSSGSFSDNNLTSVILGENIASIGSSAFNNNPLLTSVTILNSTPPTLSNVNAFGNTTQQDNTVFYIPTGSLSAYESASNWSSFAGQFVEV